jgi:hypothetical protein
MDEQREKALADFLKNAATMKLVVAQDNGLYRHLKIRNEGGNWFNWFDIVTWPGSLAINGDYGSWMFSRIDDMFAFFRLNPRDGEELRINPSYWHEKIDAEDRNTHTKTFDADYFKQNLIASYGLQDPDLLRQLDEEVFSLESEHEIYRALSDFEYESKRGKKVRFDEWYEISGKQYTFHYLYCLYSIVWAIQQYDTFKSMEEVA